jgi:hypothetical protein
MTPIPTSQVAVILERFPVGGRWGGDRWELLGAVPDMGGEARAILDTPESSQWLHPGFEVQLRRDEAEGYYLNASSEQPSVFVSIRQAEGETMPRPFQCTLSYNEAARWMDGGERVERAQAWPELAQWMAQWVEANYRPEPKKRQRPRSFEGKEGVLREKGDR